MQALQTTAVRGDMDEYQSKYHSLIVVLVLALFVAVVSLGVAIVYVGDATSYTTSK